MELKIYYIIIYIFLTIARMGFDYLKKLIVKIRFKQRIISLFQLIFYRTEKNVILAGDFNKIQNEKDYKIFTVGSKTEYKKLITVTETPKDKNIYF